MTVKLLWRSIRASFGRYLAIALIILLGVGFFTGLKSAEPAMKLTGQRYLSELGQYDYQIMTNLGLTRDDADAFASAESVSDAEGGYRLEAAVSVPGKEDEAYLLLSLPEKISLPKPVSGRMPEKENECLADADAFSEDALGTVLTVRNAEDELTGEQYTIVGLARSPRYISIDRGSTSLCGGKLRGFLYLLPDAFSSEVFHEVLLRLDRDADFFTEEYDELLASTEDSIRALAEERAEKRYQDLYAEAKEPLDDARRELDDAKQELLDAETELSDGRKKLDDSKTELVDGRRELDDSKAELADARRTLDETKRRIADGEKELADAERQLADSKKQLDDGYAQYSAALLSGIPAAFLADAKAQLDAGEAAYQAGYAAYAESKKAFDAGKQEYLSGEEKYADGLAKYEQGEADYAAGLSEYEQGERDYADALKKYGDGLSDYEDGERKYAEGLDKLNDIPEPEVYLLDKDANAGLVSFDGDIVVIGGIADAFPVFFVLIAALVCTTTMTRMVSEERTQIGTLKALGFGTGTITLKYLLYAGSAGLLGCIAGLLSGTFVLAPLIWLVYGMSYHFAPLELYISPVLYISCLAVSVLGAAAVTLLACRKELAEVPAGLIRPKAPAKGKRILLERIPFLWKRLRFLSKVMLRNAFRYKKRMAMMLVGIAGCTALLVTGFGLRDSVANILNYQYDEILLWDASVTFTENGEDVLSLSADAGADAVMGYRDKLTLYPADGRKNEKEADVLVLPQTDADRFVSLHRGKTEIAYPGAGEIVLSEKLAGKLGVVTGDTVSVSPDGKACTLRVTGVCDNYIGHYAYLSSESAEGITPNTVLYRAEDASGLAVRLRDTDGVSYVSVTEDERAVMEQTMAAMDYVVLIVIVCAGALAFIVLFNLTNINIMERLREVATVKVLGFRPGETAAYVLRENVMLSVIAGGFGLLLGKLLHRYVLLQVAIDRMTFEVRVAPMSYLYSFLITVVFALLANLFMRAKLARVNMAESLKAVE